MALHLHGGGDSQEGAAPRQRPPGLGWLSYSLRFGGRGTAIHMRRKRLLARTPDGDSDDQGVLRADHPFVPEDCYYFGYLEEVPFFHGRS